MACKAALSSAAAPTLFAKGTSATRASPPSRLKAPVLPKGTPFLGVSLAQSAQTCKVRRSRPASIARAQAVSTSEAPIKTVAKGDSDDLWLKLHGVDKWAGLLPSAENGNKIDERLRDEVIKYGEMAQLTYDSVDLNQWSRYRDQNRFSPPKMDDKGNIVPGDLFKESHLKDESFFHHLPGQGYEAVAYVYANEKTPVIKSLLDKKPGQKIRQGDVWIGYIAYSSKTRDIVVAWRGTLQPAEWIADGEVTLISYTKSGDTKSGEQKDPRANTGDFAVKAEYAAKAFLGATFYGALSAGAIAILPYAVCWYLESESLLGTVFNAAFGLVAALPIYKFVTKQVTAVKRWVAALPISKRIAALPVCESFRKQVAALPFMGLDGDAMGYFVQIYALTVFGITAWANHATPPDQFWAVNSAIFFLAVLLPTGATAAIEAYESADEGPQVHEGFFELYDPTVDEDQEQKLPQSGKSPRQVVHETLELLLKKDVRTISVTGHSLGGALAVLSAYDIVESGWNVGATGKRVPVACFAFEAPRVGNLNFKQSFEQNVKENGLAAIRVVNKPDIVTQVPKAFYLQNVYYLLAAITNQERLVNVVNWVEERFHKLKLPSAYWHVGQELLHDSREVDYLKKMPGWWAPDNISSIGNYHNLELNLHLVSGYYSGVDGEFTRDFALCNKSADAIDARAGIPPCWFGTQKVVRASGGAIIEPYRTPDDVGADDKRKIGQGPVTAKTRRCEPLVKDYFTKYPPPEQQQVKSPDGDQATSGSAVVGA